MFFAGGKTDHEISVGARGVIPGLVVRGRKNPLHQGLPARLKQARQAAGLSRRALAARAGLSNPVVRNLEAGTIPGVDTAERIAQALGISACWLAYGAEGPLPFRQKRPRGEALLLAPFESAAAEPAPPDGGAHASGPASSLQSLGLSARLTQAREARGMNRTDLWRAAGVTSTAIQNIEVSSTRAGIDTIEELALALEVAPCWLAFGEGEGPEGT